MSEPKIEFIEPPPMSDEFFNWCEEQRFKMLMASGIHPNNFTRREVYTAKQLIERYPDRNRLP